jgi:protein-S-isoprenylcysteine O-methyltransferase Ste14
MTYFLIFAASVSVLSFAWARRYFFVTADATPKLRKGLGPLGTIFAIFVLSSLSLHGEAAGENSWVALLLFCASLVLFWWAVRVYRGQRPLIAYSGHGLADLVTDGPYHLVRHPFYLAYMLFWLAGAVAVPNLVTILAVVVMGYLYVQAARGEEAQILNSHLGPIYEAYRQRTGMFFPRFIRRNQSGSDKG